MAITYYLFTSTYESVYINYAIQIIKIKSLQNDVYKWNLQKSNQITDNTTTYGAGNKIHPATKKIIV